MIELLLKNIGEFMRATTTKMSCKKKTKWEVTFWKTVPPYGNSLDNLRLLRDYRSEKYLKNIGWLS